MAQSRDDVFDATGRRTRLAGEASTNYPWGAMRGWPMNTADYTGSGVPTNGISGFHKGATWQNFKGSVGTTFYVNTGSVDSATWLNIDGPITNFNAGTITLPILITSATAAQSFVSDGTNVYVTFDSRVANSGVTNLNVTGAPPTIASAAGVTYHQVGIGAETVTLTGTTTVTAMSGLDLNLGAPTITDSSVVTVTKASTLNVAPPVAGGSVTITNAYAIETSGNVLIGGNATISGGTVNVSAVATTASIKAATAAAFVVSDGVVNMISLDTTTTASTALGKGGVTLTGEATSVASAASAFAAPTLYLAAKTNTLTGTTTTTSWLGSALYVDAQTWTDASACTLTTASSIHIVANAAAGGSLTTTNSYMISTSVAGCFLTNAGVWTSTSTAAHKEEIEDAQAQDVFGVLDSIKARSYQFKPDLCDDLGRTRFGLIAEELPAALVPPGHDEDSLPIGLPDGIAAAFAVVACKALLQENRDLKSRLDKLETLMGVQ